jgi:hypothetical protein
MGGILKAASFGRGFFTPDSVILEPDAIVHQEFLKEKEGISEPWTALIPHSQTRRVELNLFALIEEENHEYFQNGDRCTA